jgi:DNA-binding CsgD family transcriptional regulator
MPRTHVRAEDVRGIIRLLRELDDLTDDPPTFFRHMLDGLMQLIGSDGSVAAHMGDFRSGGAASFPGVLIRGFTSEAERRVLTYGLDGTAVKEPAVAELVRSYTGTVSTRIRRELVSDALWSNSPYGAEVLRVARIRDVVYSVVPGQKPTEASGLALFRTGAGSRFGDVERDLFHAFHEGMLPVYRKVAQGVDRGGERARFAAELAARHRLSPAESEVLGLLGLGLSNRDIAGRLFVSVSTVKSHVHAVLAKLGVTSRAQAGLAARGQRPIVPP